jgi:hypothetical protein
MTTYLAYHQEHKHDQFSGNDFFTSKEVERGCECFVVSADRRTAKAPVSYRLEGKYLISEVIKNTTGKYSGMDWHLKLTQLIRPSTPIPIDGNPKFDRNLFHDNFTSGGGMRAIKGKTEEFVGLFDSILGLENDRPSVILFNDLDEIDSSESDVDDPTERLDSRMSRIGQGKFRRNTIDTWGSGERCAVTGIAVPELLVASHIIPWKDDIPQRKRGCNGVMLSAHLDRLFDRHLIGFKVSRNPDLFDIFVSPRLAGQFDKLAKIGVTSRSTLDLSNVKFSDRSRLESNLRVHLASVQSNI